MERNDKRKQYARELRTNGTKEENTLWYQYLRMYPVRFRRQCVLDQYIVDFYCSKARLVIELDGSQHYEQDGLAHDVQRTQFLESLGLKVLRFSNTDVNQQLSSVCQQIDYEVQQRYHPGPLPEGVGRRAFTTNKKS